MMDATAISKYITETFAGVETVTSGSYTFFFHGPDRKLPFVTIGTADDMDQVSNLSRPGVFRLNLGISKETFQSLFGTEKVEVNRYDYTALDKLMPHPAYAAYSFVCVLNPGDATMEQVRPLLAEAYAVAVKRR